MRISREILRLAGPSILANITIPLVGMVDIAVVGHLGGGDYTSAALIGGISVGTMLFDLLYWSFGFLRTGTGGLTAQAFGEGNAILEKAILARYLRLALLWALALIALQWVIVQAAFLFVDCSPEVRSLATRYFYIRIWAAPATLSLFVMKGWFIGLQDSIRPMLTDLIINATNILLSLCLGFGWAGLPRLGLAGVAIGTVIAQWTGFLYFLVALKRLYISDLCKSLVRNLNERNQQLLQDQGVRWHQDFDLFLRSMGMIAVYIGFTIISARLGDMMLAVSAILMKLLMLFSYFTDGFAFAAEALTGRFIGAGSKAGVKSAVNACFLWGAAVTALFMLLYGVGGEPIFHLMTSDPGVVAAGKHYTGWLLLMPLIGCAAFIWDGVFIGATASKDLRNSTLLCAVGFFAFWFAGNLLWPEKPLHVLMAAYFVHLAIRALYLTLRYRPAVLDYRFSRT